MSAALLGTGRKLEVGNREKRLEILANDLDADVGAILGREVIPTLCKACSFFNASALAVAMSGRSTLTVSSYVPKWLLRSM